MKKKQEQQEQQQKEASFDVLQQTRNPFNMSMSTEELIPAEESEQSGLKLPFETVLQDDPRVLWLKTIISNQLGVFDPKYVNGLISENRYAVDNFFSTRYESQADLDRVIMFVWRTNYDKLCEEEITVLEELPRPPPPEKKEKKKGKRAKGGGGGGGGTGRKKGGQDVAESEPELGEGEGDGDGEGGEGEDATVASSGKSSARSKRKYLLQQHLMWSTIYAI